METVERPTCGKGLAANAVLPEKLGELIAALGDILAVHMQALDLADVHSKQEYEAYKDLAREFRSIASSLVTAAWEMASYRDLPMGRHDKQAMKHPRAREVFESYVSHKRDLLAHFQQAMEEDQRMLDEMRKMG